MNIVWNLVLGAWNFVFMRVGLISFHSFFQPGGVKRHILGLDKEFRKRGIYSKIIVPRRRRSENYGQDVILLGTSFPLTFSGSRSDFDINFNPLSLERTLKKEKFDVLHFHNFGLPSALQILNSPAAANTLNILTFHANTEGSNFLKLFPFALGLLNKIAQWKIDGIIGVAHHNLKVFKKYSGPKIVIPNGIDLEEFNPAAPKIKRFQAEKINILFLGRIEKRKGLIYLLRSYQILEKKFSNLRLIIVGRGELEKDCRDYIREHDLKNVYFEGAVLGQELPSYYGSCDIFVSPAIFGESFGLVLLEAMASGKPVVAFANQGYKELLKGKKGEQLLVKPKDYKTLAKKIEILIKNPELRKEMGEWGLSEARNYSWSKIASQVLDFYDFCQKEKLKRKKKRNYFYLDKIVKKVYNKKVLNWLKWPK